MASTRVWRVALRSLSHLYPSSVVGGGKLAHRTLTPAEGIVRPAACGSLARWYA